ncbi:MAG: type IV-A pilus assembly ATPase PilB, partial [Myxococcota bacterium]
ELASGRLPAGKSRQVVAVFQPLDEIQVPQQVIELIPKEVAQRHTCVPINRSGSTLVMAMADPSNIYAIDDLKFMTGYNIEVVVAPESTIQDAIVRYYGAADGAGGAQYNIDYGNLLEEFDLDDIDYHDSEDSNGIDLVLEEAEGAPVIRLVNMILVDAIKRGTSDIHIEPYEKSFRVRFRIDGVLREMMQPPLKLKAAISSRLKIMSSLDIAERRLPQDGRIKLKMGRGKEMDFRVSVLPTLFGEKIVLRLLDKSNLQLDMTKLGFRSEQLDLFLDCIHRPYGMCLVTGPTGSGKTTTLYSALSELNKVSTNISTAEDPVEFNLGGINQCQMHEAIGLNFAAALRSFLRQDPDIIMVGEIRDFETAEIAIKAALTGHMVLSTLHTNDAPGTVSRLLNMGVEPFLVTSALNVVVAQRLGRKICPDCKVPYQYSVEALRDMEVPEELLNTTIYHGSGEVNGAECPRCGGSGYKGRIAFYEVLGMNDDIKEAVLRGFSTAELKQEAIRTGMDTLRMSAIKAMLDGVTTPEEVVRNTAPDRNE